ncbi:MAG: mechanosensitive ion channel family protein [Oscillospiraceae bacterium]|nr:mechanosensitive ion channel family protein [Oscillospiraceae bacterium]
MIRYANAVSSEDLANLKASIENVTLRKALIALAMLAAAIILVRVILMAADRLLRRTKLDVSMHRFIKNVLRILLYFVALLVIASYLGIDITALVALLSVLTLAVSLSVQNALSNVAGGLLVMGTKPFKKGDFVSIDGMTGVVDEISMVYTKFHTIDNRSVLIPNSKVSAATVENYSSFPKRRLELTVSASYDADPDRVMKALRTAVDRCEPLEGEEICAAIEEFGDSAISYHIHFWIPSERFIDTRFALRTYVWEAFRAHDIEMTYPHLNVHIKNQ